MPQVELLGSIGYHAGIEVPLGGLQGWYQVGLGLELGRLKLVIAESRDLVPIMYWKSTGIPLKDRRSMHKVVLGLALRRFRYLEARGTQ